MAEISKQALIVENNQSFPNNNNGQITPSVLREFNRDMIDSTVNQTVFNNYSSSVTESLQSLAQFTASVAGTNAFTQSANIRITNLETWSSSLDVNYASQAEFNSYTQSNDAKVNSLIAFTSSVLNISALIPLNNFTASVAGTNAFTQSAQLEINALESFTASVAGTNAFTQSTTSRLNSLEAKTGSFATTGSNNFVGNQNINGSASITGSLVVTGEITANKLNVIIESSSVIFSSGSNILGDAVNDTQTLNGQVVVNGDLRVNGLSISGSSFTSAAFSNTNLTLTKGDGSSTVINGLAITGSNTFIGNQTITGSLLLTGSNSVFRGQIDVPQYLNGEQQNVIRFYQGTSGSSASSKLQFYSGSYESPNAGFVNLQSNPFNGALAISAWPANNHFVDFDIATTSSIFTAPIGGAAASPIANTIVVRTNMTVSGSTSIALRVSSSAAGGGLSTLNPLGLTLVSGSTGQITANYGRNLLSLVDSTGAPTTIRYIAMAQNPSLLGIPTTTGYTAPSILAMNSGSQPEPVISFENRGNYTNGLITMVKPTRFLSGSITSGSALITGSLNVIGDTTITGSLTLSSSAAIELNIVGNSVITGSITSNVTNITIASQTASLDFNSGNLFELTLVSGSTTRLETANIKAGQTINLLVSQPLVGYGDLAYGGTFKFTSGNSYVPTQVAAAKDIVTFLTFADTTAIYGASVKNLV